MHKWECNYQEIPIIFVKLLNNLNKMSKTKQLLSEESIIEHMDDYDYRYAEYLNIRREVAYDSHRQNEKKDNYENSRLWNWPSDVS